MKNFFKFAVLMLALAFALPSFGQTALVQTTLGGTISQGQTQFVLGSLTGISPQGAINNAVGGTTGGTAIVSVLYVDRELMWVVSTNTSAKSVSVLRGQAGTQASAHASGAMVLSGPPQAFFSFNPEGYCATITGRSGNVMQPPQYTPWVNQLTGQQWLCSSVSKTWVPGFGNPGVSGTPPSVTTLVASAAGTVTPSGPLFHINGTAAITGFNIPVGCAATTVSSCTFTVIPDAAFTWTTATNIAVSGTAVANLMITFTWDPVNSKWVQMQSK